MIESSCDVKNPINSRIILVAELVISLKGTTKGSGEFSRRVVQDFGKCLDTPSDRGVLRGRE